ncbi:phage tail tube protein [Gryllotalpicola koreensis]|uniref:Phage tail protein n=1 Tax=Gryllotalpicola koreensis TaxID=993086 RepID=A0ABP8A1P1_9MICO
MPEIQVSALARKFAVEVTDDIDDLTSATWTAVNGVTDFQPQITANVQDASDYDTNGWASSETTMYSWTAQVTFFRKYATSPSVTYDAGQEMIRARVGKFAPDNRIGFRWYDRNGGPEANSGVAIVDWKRSNTAVTNLEQAQVTLTGTDVPLNIDIDNPAASAS